MKWTRLLGRTRLGREWAVRFLLLLLLACAAAYYAWNLLQWLAYDDEGGYLYASWRISLGELPYRDFLTPQLPLFLYPGALVLKLTGNSVLGARVAMIALCLATAAVLFVTIRRFWGARAAFLSLVLLLPQREFFWAARFYRPEAPMLLFSVVGLYLFASGYPARQRWKLALSGAAMGLAMMSKLFGALTIVGVGLFILSDAVRARDWRGGLKMLLTIGIPFATVLVSIGGLFLALAPNFIAAVLGHHVRQGSGMPFIEVARKTLGLYWSSISFQPMWVLLAALGVVLAVRSRDFLGRLLAWQVPTALSFFVITRSLDSRHLTYLVPSMAALGGLAVDRVWAILGARRSAWLRSLVVAPCVLGAFFLALLPSWVRNDEIITRLPDDTAEWVEYLRAHTGPADVILSDYPGINFFAQRRTTAKGAGLSGGATEGGQILGSDLIQEIEADNVQMVLLNVAQGSHQLIRLRDYAAFKQYVQEHFLLADRRHYDDRLMEVYSRRDLWEGRVELVNWENELKLTGIDWLRGRAQPGGDLQIKMRWQATAPMSLDYGVTLRLMDQEGHEWGLGHKTLADIEGATYWDERGLERPLAIPTSQWPLWETTVQTFELPVDLATPPGMYKVLLRVHPKETWNGPHVLDAEGVLIGHDWEVGYARVLQAQAPPDLAALGIDHQAEVDLRDGMRLLGYSNLPKSVRPGDRFSLSLFWSASDTVRGDYMARVTLRANGSTWGTAQVSPARSDYATYRWRPGEVLRGQYDVLVDAETPGGSYEVWLELVDEQGVVVPQPFLMGRIQVEGRQRLYQEPQVAHPVRAEFGALATLLGYDLEKPDIRLGESLRVVLYWRAEGKTATSHKVFVHVIDASDRVWAQQDNEPVQGSYPTTGWLPGEIVVDPYEIPVPENVQPGTYQLEVGLYDPQTGVRLAIVDASRKRQTGDRLILQDILVASP